MSGFTPVNQVRLTNVAAVRLQKRGKRFEIACYRNKVLSWRNKLETNIREVLQIDTVFTNVSKGMLANTKDLMDCFGTTDQRAVCQEILDKGELQVSEQERGALYETIFRDIASIVVDKTVNPENNKPYTIALIQNAMKQIQYSVNVSKTSKSQALEVIRKLRDVMPIARASMLLRVVYPSEDGEVVTKEVEKVGGVIVSRSQPSSSSALTEEFLDVKIDPEYYRKMEELVKIVGSGKSRLEVLQMRMASTVGGVGGAATESKEAHYDDDSEDDQPQPSQQKGKKKASSSTNKSSSKIESSKRKDDLQNLLSEVTGISDLVDEDVPDEYEVAEQLMNNKKGKKKDKAKKVVADDSDQSPPPLPQIIEEHDTVSVTSSKTKASEAPSLANDQSKMVKKSKKDKKFDKEEQLEKEREAKLLQERILAQKKKAQAEAQPSQPVSETADNTASTVTTAEASPAETTQPIVGSAAAATKVQSCNTCGGSFHDTKEYRDHFKSEWHRFNLKRKMKNLPLITSEIEFLQLSVDQLQI